MPETVNELTHTPGPWACRPPCGKDGTLFVRSERPYPRAMTIAAVLPHGACEGGAAYWEEEQQANARLIAAAPALLEACQATLHWLHLLPTETQELIRAALAAAR